MSKGHKKCPEISAAGRYDPGMNSFGWRGARPMWAKIVSWLRIIVSWLGVIFVIFASWVLAVMVRDLVQILLLRFGGGIHPGMRFFLLPRIVPAVLMLLIFGVGAALMRAKFRGATVWKTIASLAVVFGMLGLIMGITD
jgi:hypothetical protein